MGRKDGRGVFGGCRGEVSGESNADIGVETRAPHKDKILAQLVDAEVVRVSVVVVGVVCACRVEEKLKGLSKALACVEIL